MFKKIKKIQNMAVYNDFNWDQTVKEVNGHIAELKKVNIFYGRNYSGKTTLSRIFRAFETGCISDKYQSSVFELEHSDGTTTSNTDIPSTGYEVRVFNEDFIRDNLQFIVDSDKNISAFAVLGDDNNRIEAEINAKELELGSEEENTGKLAIKKQKTTVFLTAKAALDNAKSSLDSKITDKANKKDSGIKHNKIFGEATYNSPKLIKDIESVLKESFAPLTDEKTPELETLLKEDTKNNIEQYPEFNLKFDALKESARNLIEKKISLTNPIKELVEDSLLEAWVRSGRSHHEGKRTNCGFCGSPLPKDLWEKLDQHFNQESEDLRTDIKRIISDIDAEIDRIPTLLVIENNAYYSTYRAELAAVKSSFDINCKNYIDNLNKLIGCLNERDSDIFNSRNLPDLTDFSDVLSGAHVELDKTRIRSNELTSNLSKKKSIAREQLRLKEVFNFVSDIKYSDELENISNLQKHANECESERNAAIKIIESIQSEISKLKAELKDETKGADGVNHYLNDFFGHQELSLKSEETESGYKFEVIRHGRKAHHLSEGECSLIAFCYFMAKLEDVETKGNRPIIYIDDPVSSLDSNHIFFVFSLINSEIVKPAKFSQLFISTHNLDFLKYLKRLIPKDFEGNDLERRYFIVERSGEKSNIRLMPKYLKNYVTEFNYLFHQLFKCANAPDIAQDDEHECFYNYGNSARKFLEAFLYFKYPNANEKDDSKLEKFFGGDLHSSLLIDRINNEYSHLAGVFERSINPIDVPEMKSSAQFIMKKIKERDPEQYSSLLESIGNPDVNF